MAKARRTKSDAADDAETSAAAGGADGNVDQIREILFGGQMRDFDRRFTRLEEKLERERNQLQEDLTARFDQLQQRLHDTSEDFDAAMRKEREERISGLNDLAGQIDALEKDLISRLDKLADASEAEAKAIRQRLQEDVQTLGDTMRQQRDELAANMDKESQALHDAKVSRESLADMLQEVSLRLKAGFSLDGIG